MRKAVAKTGNSRWPQMLLLVTALIGLGLAGAQITFGKLNLAGNSVQSINLYGAEYASQATLNELVNVKREGSLVRVTGLGHVLLLPIDEDQVRSTTDFNTVQLDAERVKARTATWVNGNIYLPLDTLARGLGANYQVGQFKLPQRTLQSVSSRTGANTDRLVLDVSREVSVRDELRGTNLRITLKDTQASAQQYTTRGAFIPFAQVTQEGANAVVSFTLPQNSGYRVYPVVRPGGTRIVIDAGPGIPVSTPALMERVAKPLIVLDPLKVSGLGRDVTLEVARRAAELLTSSGWQVKLTREQGSALSRAQKSQLARQSDVYLTLDLGRLAGSSRSGVTVYENAGSSTFKYVAALRNGQSVPYGNLAVGDTGGTRRLAELLRGELKGGGVTASGSSISRVVNLSEAAQAALLLELGWANNPQDRANLATDARLQALSVAVARSVATYLTARANNSNAVASAGGQP